MNGRLQVFGSDFNPNVVAREAGDMREVSSTMKVYHLVIEYSYIVVRANKSCPCQ